MNGYFILHQGWNKLLCENQRNISPTWAARQVMQVKQQNCRMTCDIGEETEGLGNEAEPHSPTLLLLHQHHSSFSNPSISSPMSQVILQPFQCFTYFTSTSPTSHDEPPMISNLSFLELHSSGSDTMNYFALKNHRIEIQSMKVTVEKKKNCLVKSSIVII